MWQQLATQLDRLLSQPPNSSSAPRLTEARMSIMFPGLRRTCELHPVTELYNTVSPPDECTVGVRNTSTTNNPHGAAMIHQLLPFLSFYINQFPSANISLCLSLSVWAIKGRFVYSRTKMALALFLTTEVYTLVADHSLGTIFLFYLFWRLQWFHITIQSQVKSNERFRPSRTSSMKTFSEVSLCGMGPKFLIELCIFRYLEK